MVHRMEKQLSKSEKSILDGSIKDSPLCFMAACDALIGKASGEVLPCVAAKILNQQLAQEEVNQV